MTSVIHKKRALYRRARRLTDLSVSSLANTWNRSAIQSARAPAPKRERARKRERERESARMRAKEREREREKMTETMREHSEMGLLKVNK